LENKIPFIVWLGENEIKERKVKVKNTYKKEEVDVAIFFRVCISSIDLNLNETKKSSWEYGVI